jgi:hypothetical protein
VFILTNSEFIYPPLAVKVSMKRPSLTCCEGSDVKITVVSQANCPSQGAEKVNFNGWKYSRERVFCKASRS